MPPLPFLVFVVGTGSLGAEIAAVRLLAPYFGASTIVWANTIGIVLVALSIGYWLGGRLADRHPNMRALCLRGAPRRGAARARARSWPTRCSTWRSTRSTRSRPARSSARCSRVLVLVAVPVLLLGTVSPWAIRLAVHSVEEAGTVAGPPVRALHRRLAASGTLLSALLLIPLVGTRRTFLIFALAIAVVAVWGLRPVRPLGARAGGDRRADRAAGGHAQGRHGRQRPRDPRGRDRVPVRARDRGRRRRRGRSS